jgi:hypothetical protein
MYVRPIRLWFLCPAAVCLQITQVFFSVCGMARVHASAAKIMRRRYAQSSPSVQNLCFPAVLSRGFSGTSSTKPTLSRSLQEVTGFQKQALQRRGTLAGIQADNWAAAAEARAPLLQLLPAAYRERFAPRRRANQPPTECGLDQAPVLYLGRACRGVSQLFGTHLDQWSAANVRKR